MNYAIVSLHTGFVREVGSLQSERSLTLDQLARFSAHLRFLAVERNLSVRQIAVAANLSSGSIQRLLSGQQEPRLGTLLALVEVFRLGSIEQLLGVLPSELLRAHDTFLVAATA